MTANTIVYSSYSYRRSDPNRKWNAKMNASKARRNMQLLKYKLMLIIGIVLILLFTVSHAMISKAAANETTYFKYYTSIVVYPGHTLTQIAAKYMDSMHYDSTAEYVDEVKYMNHIDDADKIHAGDYLIVPYYSTEFKE